MTAVTEVTYADVSDFDIEANIERTTFDRSTGRFSTLFGEHARERLLALCPDLYEQMVSDGSFEATIIDVADRWRIRMIEMGDQGTDFETRDELCRHDLVVELTGLSDDEVG